VFCLSTHELFAIKSMSFFQPCFKLRTVLQFKPWAPCFKLRAVLYFKPWAIHMCATLFSSELRSIACSKLDIKLYAESWSPVCPRAFDAPTQRVVSREFLQICTTWSTSHPSRRSSL
jgi:hypothetical protein